MAGNANSGRRAGKPLTATAIKQLYKGIDRKTPDGLAAVLRRADEWRMSGRMDAGIHQAIIHSTKEQRHLYTVEAMRREVEELRASMRSLLDEQRAHLSHRDIGPPDDDLH